ncbi:MAG: hypothetical protein BJ554DRAFT_3569 [Olpidium bornovanus]|uniref:Uncharacterized protein n=1 Tax=Olpidium bornovanus TaxID=278681 RepID=A0A8H8DFK6_9FUNG|nr:MAG: hypothetical protein BJ554DRAFT_3569 [Olpidium bornovanus]
MQKVVDTHRLERQNRVRQVLTLDLRDRTRQHLISVACLRVQSVALAGSRSPGTARPLPRLRLANRCHNQRVHSQLRVVRILLHETRVHHVVDAVYRDARFSDVRGQHYLARAGSRRLENTTLHLRRKRRVHGQDDQFRNHRS